LAVEVCNLIGPFVGGKKDEKVQIIYLIGSVQAILGCFCERAILEGEEHVFQYGI